MFSQKLILAKSVHVFVPAKFVLVPIGVITPDGVEMIFRVQGASAETLKSQIKPAKFINGVPFLKATSWKAVAQVAKTSADDLERTVSDLVARVDELEGRVKDLEDKVK